MLLKNPSTDVTAKMTKTHWLMTKGPRSANDIVSDFWRPMTDRPLPVTRASVVELIELELKRALEFGEALGRDNP